LTTTPKAHDGPLIFIETTTWPRCQPRREDSWPPTPRRLNACYSWLSLPQHYGPTNDSDMVMVKILGNPLAPRIEGINQLVRPQLVQQLDAAVFDQVSVHGGKRLVCQSSVNGFAELDKLCGLNRKIWHDRPPYDGRTRSNGRNEKESIALSHGPMGKDIGLAS
jgi:hypothetical protein